MIGRESLEWCFAAWVRAACAQWIDLCWTCEAGLTLHRCHFERRRGAHATWGNKVRGPRDHTYIHTYSTVRCELPKVRTRAVSIAYTGVRQDPPIDGIDSAAQQGRDAAHAAHKRAMLRHVHDYVTHAEEVFGF